MHSAASAGKVGQTPSRRPRRGSGASRQSPLWYTRELPRSAGSTFRP